MQPEINSERETVKSEQAMNGEYSNTGYERWLLNPNSDQCRDGHTTTFTLTNTAPVDACFNHGNWKQIEKAMKGNLKDLP